MKFRFYMHICFLAFLVFAPPLLYAEDITITGNDCAMRGENGIVYLQDSSGNDLMQLRGFDLVWVDPVARGGTLQQVSPKQLAIDYTIQDYTGGDVSAQGLFTLNGNKVTASFTVTVPSGMTVAGAMVSRQEINGLGMTLMDDGVTRRHSYSNPVYVFEEITGNSSWVDPWGQHMTFESVGENTYICSIDFIIAPQVIQGDNCAMRADNGVVYIQDGSGNDLMQLSGFDLGWVDPIAQGGTLQQVSPNQFAIDYDIQDYTGDDVTANGIFTLNGNTVTADLTVTVPSGMTVAGAMILRQSINGTGMSLMDDGIRQHSYSNPISIFEEITGNSSWVDSIHQHISFVSVGNNTYTCSIDFTVAPHVIQGDNCAMRGDNGVVYIQDASGNDLMYFSGFDLVWESPYAMGGTLQLIGPNKMAIDYTINDYSGSDVMGSATFTLNGNKLTADYTVTVPDGMTVAGAMAMRRQINGTGMSLLDDGVTRRHSYSNPVYVFEEITGNSSWVDQWKQHMTFVSIGDNTYSCSIDFTVGTQVIQGDGCSMRGENGVLYIQDAYGTDVMKLSGLDMVWESPVASGGTLQQISANQLAIDYNIQDDSSGEVSARAVYTLTGKTVTADFTLTTASGMTTGGVVILRQALNSTDNVIDKIGYWVRDDSGGVPYETRSAYLHRFNYSQLQSVFERINGNWGWMDSTSTHTSFTLDSGTTYTASTQYVVGPEEYNSQSVAEFMNDRETTISFINEYRAFNLWGDSETPRVTVQVTNTDEYDLSATLYIEARDFDGNLIVNTQRSLLLEPWKNTVKSFNISVPTVPGIAFVEARVMSGTTELCFSRTNVGVLHAYNYQYREDSAFGISAYFDVPSADDAKSILNRMGIRWIRSGDSTSTLPDIGAVSCYHSNVSPTQWSTDQAAKIAYFQSTLASCDAKGNPYWEFGNEWNFQGTAVASTYVNDWLVPLNAQRAGYDVEIMSMGIGGADTAFMDAINSNGGWPLIDAISLHPGRGNFTPDYTNAYWSYLGAIRNTKQKIAQYGNKPLWLTEVYACTHPNDDWKDSYRRAAENIILTYALGVAEGCAGIEFYQLQDGRWSDVGGVNVSDSEYHYGILLRDGTLKPSLLSFCAIAEALDGATFDKEISFGLYPNIKGLQFNTPNGNMAILWNRQDGYVYDDSTGLEPWEDHWDTSTQIEVDASSSSVTVVDCIGRSTTVYPTLGVADLTVTGAPIIVTGLDAQ